MENQNKYLLLARRAREENNVEDAKKYYDIVNGISDNAKKGTRAELLNAKVTLNCYANTNYVKTYRLDTVKE